MKSIKDIEEEEILRVQKELITASERGVISLKNYKDPLLNEYEKRLLLKRIVELRRQRGFFGFFRRIFGLS